MARPQKNNAEYFSHDADMRNDPKIKAIRSKFGLIGYAVWNMILETLTDKDYFEYELSPLNIELLAGDIGIESENLDEIIKYFIKVDLLQSNNNILSSDVHKKRLKPMVDKREQQKIRYEEAKNKKLGISATECDGYDFPPSEIDNDVLISMTNEQNNSLIANIDNKMSIGKNGVSVAEISSNNNNNINTGAETQVNKELLLHSAAETIQSKVNESKLKKRIYKKEEEEEEIFAKFPDDIDFKYKKIFQKGKYPKYILNSKHLFAGVRFALWFKSKLSKSLKTTQKQLQDWLIIYVRLVENENLNKEQIKKICEFAFEDEFWSKQFLSANKLLKRNKDGFKYWEVFKNTSDKNNSVSKDNSNHYRKTYAVI